MPLIGASYVQFTAGYEKDVIPDWFATGILLGIDLFYNNAVKNNIQSTNFIRSLAQQQQALRIGYDVHDL